MQNRESWIPTKYVRKNGKLIASRDPMEVGVASRLVADLIAETYDTHLGRYASGRLLDLGCGKVPLYLAYKAYVTDNTCVDWGNTLHGNKHLDVECDLTQRLPFENETFDTIILSDVLEHIPQPELLWMEMSRILAKGGKILMNVPFYYWIHEHPHDYYRYTEFALRRFVDLSGLCLVRLEAVGGAPEILTDIFAKNILRVPKLGRTLAAVAQWLTGSFIRTGVGKRISDATKENFPFSYFLVAEKQTTSPTVS